MMAYVERQTPRVEQGQNSFQFAFGILTRQQQALLS
jgi:hypothetical protein